MRIAVVGLASSCLVTYEPSLWDRRYHMGQDLWADATDVFEMHERDHWGHGDRLSYLTQTDATVWMRDPWSDLEATSFPLYDVMVACRMAEPYFECTAAYMLGHAISQRPERIGLYGITGEDEYRQRANLEYLIGVGRGKGIDVWVHPGSDFFDSQWQCGQYGRQDPKEAA